MNKETIDQTNPNTCLKMVFDMVHTPPATYYNVNTNNKACISTIYSITTYLNTSNHMQQKSSKELVAEMIEAGLLCFHDQLAVLNA